MEHGPNILSIKQARATEHLHKTQFATDKPDTLTKAETGEAGKILDQSSTMIKVFDRVKAEAANVSSGKNTGPPEKIEKALVTAKTL